MLLKRLIIVGYPEGNLAGAIYKHAYAEALVNSGKFKVMFYKPEMKLSGLNLSGIVVIYAGKGGRLQETYELCETYDLPLIQAATGLAKPENPGFPFINAPNLSPLIVTFFKALKNFKAPYEPLMDQLTIKIQESHQKSKKTVPGTAKKMSEILGYEFKPEQDSIRDHTRQLKEIGIPGEHLGRHAYHNITIEGFMAEIGLTTRVLGLDTYGVGALWFAERILARDNKGMLDDGYQEIEEFLEEIK